MNLKHVIVKDGFVGIMKPEKYHIFYPENAQQPPPLEDIFFNTENPISVICKDEIELNSLLEKISEHYCKILKSIRQYEGIHVIEINGIFFVSLETSYIEEDKREQVMNNFIVNSRSNPICLSSLIEYRKQVESGTFEDLPFDKLEDFFQNKFVDLKELYIEKNEEDKYEEISRSLKYYLKLLNSFGGDSQKEKIDFIVDSLMKSLRLHYKQ